jgi:hypothetical protein
MATIGITTVPSGMAPTAGAAQELSVESTLEIKTVRDKSGVVSKAVPMKYKKVTTTLRGYGDATSILASVTAGAFTSGKKLIEVKLSESNEDFPQFDSTQVEYITV